MRSPLGIPNDLPKYSIRTYNERAIYGGEYTAIMTEDEIDKLYAYLVQKTIEKRKLIALTSHSGENDLGGQIFDPNLGIEYCPCCFTAFRPKVGSELSCGHLVCPDCSKRMPEYKPGDFYEQWKHQCPLCRGANSIHY